MAAYSVPEILAEKPCKPELCRMTSPGSPVNSTTLKRHVTVDTSPLHEMPNPFFCRPPIGKQLLEPGHLSCQSPFQFPALEKSGLCRIYRRTHFFQSGPPQLRHGPSLLSEHFHQPVTTRDGKRQQTAPSRCVTSPRWSRHSRPAGTRPCWEVFSPPRLSRLYSTLDRDTNRMTTGATTAHELGRVLFFGLGFSYWERALFPAICHLVSTRIKGYAS